MVTPVFCWTVLMVHAAAEAMSPPLSQPVANAELNIAVRRAGGLAVRHRARRDVHEGVAGDRDQLDPGPVRGDVQDHRGVRAHALGLAADLAVLAVALVGAEDQDVHRPARRSGRPGPAPWSASASGSPAPRRRPGRCCRGAWPRRRRTPARTGTTSDGDRRTSAIAAQRRRASADVGRAGRHEGARTEAWRDSHPTIVGGGCLVGGEHTQGRGGGSVQISDGLPPSWAYFASVASFCGRHQASLRLVPGDRRLETGAEVRVPRLPAELVAQLRGVDRVAQVVAGSVAHQVVGVLADWPMISRMSSTTVLLFSSPSAPMR